MTLPDYIDLEPADVAAAAARRGDDSIRYVQEWSRAGTVVEGKLRISRDAYLALHDRWASGSPARKVQAGWGQMLAGISQTLFRWGRGGFRWLGGAALAIRVARCVSCPHRLPGPPERCALCGCGLRAKRRLPEGRCPEGRW